MVVVSLNGSHSLVGMHYISFILLLLYPALLCTNFYPKKKRNLLTALSYTTVNTVQL